MSATQYQSPIQRLFREAFDKGNLAVVDEVLISDCIVHNSETGLINDIDVMKRLISTFRTAFPDLQCVVEDEIMDVRKVAAYWTMSGTHKGLYMGITPTGKSMKIQGIIFASLANGMITEYWISIDQYGMLQQLGIIPR
jgi:steroid delta-isomerase-like uncharacterized protein